MADRRQRPKLHITATGTAGSGNAAITVMYYIYWMFYDQGKVNYAAAAAILFLIVILLITVVQRAVSKKFVHYV